jgi:hypothetical protein
MLWAARIALVGILLSSTSTVAIAADVDLIGADRVADRQLDRAPSPGTATAAAPADSAAQQDAQDGGWLVDPRSGCRVLDANYDDGDAASWSGACRNGLAEGAGTLSFSNAGAVLETVAANLHRGVVQDGHVIAAWSDGSKYDGEEVGGHMNGAGIFTSAKGDRLEGQWTNDTLGGRVKIVWANGDRYEGDWRDGQANGRGLEIWANGDRYDGEWRDGKAEGMGSQKWADGRAYSGAWRNDLPAQALARADSPRMAGPSPTVAPNMSFASQIPVAMAAGATGAVGGLASVPSTMIATSASASAQSDVDAQSQSAILDGLAGTRLVSVDGSSIAFTATEAGFTREIARSDGAAQATSFNFINDRLGTVTSTEDPSQTIGLFRVTDSEIDVNYADGRSEVLTPNRTGGLSIALAAPNGNTYCMSWYPQGHMFSDAERKAAVAAYADRLGANAAPSSAGSCADGAIAKTAAAQAVSPARNPTANLQNIPRPIPKPMRVSFVTQSPTRWPTAAPMSLAQASDAPLAQASSGIVVVRESTVHTIDAGADPSAPASPQASLDPATLPDSASSCLSIDSDGVHWGFRNHCGYSVQFAYCLMSDPEGLAGCRDGGVSGSVAPNGFGALVADKSIRETGGDHDFRWIACSGGAGEVVPHLDRADPPVGRCVRPKAS